MIWFRNSEAREQDRQVLLQGEAIMGEEEFEFLFTTLRTERAYFAANRGKMLEYLKFLEETGSRLSDRRLQQRMQSLHQALRDLKAHTAAHFLAFPRNQTGENIRFTLHPDYFTLEATDLSIEEHSFYLKAERQLGELLARAATSYQAFRTLARRKLNI